MSESEILVYLDKTGKPQLVGRLWVRTRGGREGASFRYDPTWLQNPERFALEPALTLGDGAYHTSSGKALFGAFGDSAPDRWGRMLMNRNEHRRARKQSSTPRALRELDYLLGVSDEARQGALRFSLQPNGPFLADAGGATIPLLVDLPRLLDAADHVLDDDESSEDLRLILAPGSSLGGARPKASLRKSDGTLAIAKFATAKDDYDVVRSEALALSLARTAGITTAAWQLETILGRGVLVVDRFDRSSIARIPFLSAMSMLGATDHESHSYLELADAISQHGANAQHDSHELWRRVLFTVLISNTDDHLRNHAFLYQGTEGWRLSPAYDVNPTPRDVKPRVLSTNIDETNATASTDLVFSIAGRFRLSPDKARAIAKEVANATSKWDRVATGLGIGKRDRERLEASFEHDDLRDAQRN